MLQLTLPDEGYGDSALHIYLFTPQLPLVLTASTHRRMARLSLPQLLVTYHFTNQQIVTHSSTIWVWS